MILITGGAGFIGSNIAADFQERNHDIAICVWLGHGDKWKNIQKLVPQDIITPEALPHRLDNRCNELTAVIHMSVISATRYFEQSYLSSENKYR